MDTLTGPAMGSNRQLMDGNWRTLRKLSYVGLIWMCACYIAFRFGTGDLSQVSNNFFYLSVYLSNCFIYLLDIITVIIG